MIDRSFIGASLADSTLSIDAARLKFFAEAIGETNPIYVDDDAARAAGHKDILVPPTFLMAGTMDSGVMFDMLDRMNVSLGKVLHGEQQFEYLAPVFVGDIVSISSIIVDIFDKKNGALEFIITENTVTNQHSIVVAKMRATTVVRH